jgi:fatty acid synthase
VALVDLLRAIGIEADGLIGHSVGELICAYVDGSFSFEQTILTSFLRARSIMDSKLIKGSMAAIGKSYY